MNGSRIRREIAECGRRLYARGLVGAFDGNISVRSGPDRVWTTPTGVPKGFLKPRDIVCVDLEGRIRKGRRKPSSELKMHLRVYRENPEVRAVVHAHPPVASAFAVAGRPLDRPILTESFVMLGAVPVAPYATPGTHEVPDAIAPFCRESCAVLLANHGVLTWGRDLAEAYGRMESVEQYATVTMNAERLVGGNGDIPADRLPELIRIRSDLGIRSGGASGASAGTEEGRDDVL